MITTPADYLSLLHKIQQDRDYKIGEGNRPTGLIVLPTDEKIYNINLNTRVVQAPEFLSVTSEHNAEILWFKANRFFDNIDLATSSCWIQFVNAQGDELFCAVPVIVGLERYGNESILIPWPVGQYSGRYRF